MTIKQIFDEIAAESGSNKKMEILAKYKDNELLKNVLYLTYSPRVKFYIKQIPEYSRLETHTHSLEGALMALELLSTRYLTGNKAIQHLKEILMCCEPDNAYVIEKVIGKDAKIGMATSNINKVFDKLIEETPYQGAVSYNPARIKKLFLNGGRAYSQVKMDGRYANAIIWDSNAEFESRQGEITYLTGAKVLKELSTILNDCVLNGELTIKDKPRYESNGIISSLVSIGSKRAKGNDVSKEIIEFEKEYDMPIQVALDSIIYTVWDRLTIEEYHNAKSERPYDSRLSIIETELALKNLECVKIIEGKIVSSFEEAMIHFQEMLNKGEEGTIIKSATAGWRDGKPTYQCKLKLDIRIDLKIVGFQYGKKGKKNEKVISTLLTESSCGMLKTDPSNMDEKTMRYVTDNQDILLGGIVEIKCCGLSKNVNGEYSTLHPSVVKIRDDKSTCDSLESAKEIERMAKMLK